MTALPTWLAERCPGGPALLAHVKLAHPKGAHPKPARRGRATRWAVAAAGLAAAGLAAGLLLAGGSPALLVATFPEKVRLITNERAYYDPHLAGVHVSPVWVVTSGSLFGVHGAGWTGVPDDASPNVSSSNGTDSAVFRAVTRRRNFGDVSVSFDLRAAGFVTTARTPATPYDGVHVFLRYQNQRYLYVVSVYRRDGIVAVKEKVPGGPANGGTYFTLGEAPYRIPMDKWVPVDVTIVTVAKDAVRIDLSINAHKVLSAMSTPAHVAPILKSGRVGLRGDNCQFYFRDFTVRPAS
jgi:hypothetical protein